MDKANPHRKQIQICRHCHTGGLWYHSDGKRYWYSTSKNYDKPHICTDGEERSWPTQYRYTPKPEEELMAEAEAVVGKLFNVATSTKKP